MFFITLKLKNIVRFALADKRVNTDHKNQWKTQKYKNQRRCVYISGSQ